MRYHWRRLAPILFRLLRLDLAEDILGGFSTAMILVIALVSLTAIFLIFALTLFAARLDVAESARKATRNLGVAVGQQIKRDLEMLDLSLQDLVDEAGNPTIYNLDQATRREVLFDRPASGRGHGALLLIDATGHLVEQAGVETAAPIDFSHDAFFQVHTGSADPGLYFSGPFVSVIDGENSVALSRRIMRDGVFAGVGVATIRLSWIQTFFRTLDLGEGGSATFASKDGEVLVRQPFVAGAVGIRLRDPAALRHLASDVPNQFEDTSPFDGIARLFCTNPVGPYPFSVSIGESLDDIYAAWWRRAGTTGLAMLLLGNVILVLIAALQVALRHRKLAEAALATLARTDKLTGLANRRHFDETLEREWEQARRGQRPLALLLLDVDHFKAFNDLFGHQGGDAGLAAVAGCIARSARSPADLTSRYGGEEFAILLPDTTAAQALTVARTIERLIRDLRQPHPGSPTNFLTVSIGAVALTPAAGLEPDDLVRGADVSLYEAKRAGRDRVILWVERHAA